MFPDKIIISDLPSITFYEHLRLGLYPVLSRDSVLSLSEVQLFISFHIVYSALHDVHGAPVPEKEIKEFHEAVLEGNEAKAQALLSSKYTKVDQKYINMD